jgi:hypothetical protein
VLSVGAGPPAYVEEGLRNLFNIPHRVKNATTHFGEHLARAAICWEQGHKDVALLEGLGAVEDSSNATVEMLSVATMIEPALPTRVPSPSAPSVRPQLALPEPAPTPSAPALVEVTATTETAVVRAEATAASTGARTEVTALEAVANVDDAVRAEGSNAIVASRGAAAGTAPPVQLAVVEEPVTAHLANNPAAPAAGTATAPTVARAASHGSGPSPGVIEVSDRYPSTGAFRNYTPPQRIGAMEFVFDPTTGRFAVGRASAPGLSPHQGLARAIAADPQNVVGGMLSKSLSNVVMTNEFSGHYWRNWTDEIRITFRQFLESRSGLRVNHHPGM